MDDHRNLAGSGTDANLVLKVPTRMWLLGEEYPFSESIMFDSASLGTKRGALKLFIISLVRELVEADDTV